MGGIKMTVESIEGSGFPLCFMTKDKKEPLSILGTKEARDTITVEARMLKGHQKEAVVTQGGGGSAWRLTTDEGKHLKGTDLAPFPLGYFNAGLHGDLHGRIRSLASERGISVADASMTIRNYYWMTGSFAKGTSQGHVDPSDINITADANADELAALVKDAVDASPAIAAMTTAITNTFAIYINGRRRNVTSLTNSPSANATDPYIAYSAPPKPSEGALDYSTLIRHSGVTQEGNVGIAPPSTNTRIIRTVAGTSHMTADGLVETDTSLIMPGVSHFVLSTDERPEENSAPCGLAMLSAGTTFCYMTQIARFIEHMKLDIRDVRIVQHNPYALRRDGGRLIGVAEPVDTHLFLNGKADDETHERLMKVAEVMCYLHATLINALPPKVSTRTRQK
jgi:uncharacterized OsmC-like protein